MTGAVLCMAFYNVWSRPFIERSSALGFLAVGMGAGAAALILVGLLTDRVAILSSFGAPQWIARLSRSWRRRSRVCSMRLGSRENYTNPSGQYHDRQPNRGGIARRSARRRANHSQSDHRTGRSIFRHLDRYDRGRKKLTCITLSAAFVRQLVDKANTSSPTTKT